MADPVSVRATPTSTFIFEVLVRQMPPFEGAILFFSMQDLPAEATGTVARFSCGARMGNYCTTGLSAVRGNCSSV
jgi:hypothetical protein